LGERLLCKQEVVGSIPSASRPVRLQGRGLGPAGCGVMERVERVWVSRAASLPLGGVWRLGPEVCVLYGL